MTPAQSQRAELVRFGVLGYGFIADAHAQALAGVPDAEVAAVCGPREAPAREFAERFGIGFVTTEPQRMLAADIDAVVICTPDYAHHEQALAAAAAGKHVFCEKPVAMNLEQANEMVAACERANVRTMTGFLLRYAPIAEELVKRVQAGGFGELVSIQTQRYNASLLRPDAAARWRLDESRSAAGVLSDLGSHMLDFSLLIGGPITHLAASLRTVIKKVPDPATGETLPLTLDDDAVLALRFASGVHGTIATSRVGHFDSDRPLGRAMIQINGTKAAAVTDGVERAEVHRHGHSTEAIEPNLGPGVHDHAGVLATMSRRMFGEFVAAIRSGQDRPPTMRDGWQVQALVETARRAAESGRWEEVPTAP
ncbi:MAG: hypothetical protein CL878_07810 [Dehalococcoidia bacterium]|nr:hypothetical protein [Dehalococcoidia bacterium]